MKRNILILSLLLFAGSTAMAFEPPRMHPTDRFILTLFTDLWQEVPQDIDLRAIQRGVGLTMMQDMPLGRSNFSIAAGLGFSGHNLYSDHVYAYDPVMDGYRFQPIIEDYDKNKISLNYLGVPVQFRYRSRNTPRTFRLYAGIQADYLVNAHTKFHGRAGPVLPIQQPWPTGRDIEIKEHSLDNLLSYRIGLNALVGYGSLNFHFGYTLTRIFEDNPAENMFPVSLGFSFILF